MNKYKSNKFKSYLLTVFFLFLISYLLSLNSVFAQASLPLQVSPVRIQLNITPGVETTTIVKFFNLTNSPLVGEVKVVDFVVDNLEGQARLIDNPEKRNPKFSAASWIKNPFSRTITIAPNDVLSVPLSITPPLDVRPGGRYAAVYFQTLGQNLSKNESGAGIQHRIAALLYMRAPGEINEAALISRLYAPSFQEYGPVEVETQIGNRGDYHITPKGTLRLTDTFGSLVEQAVIKDRNVFPDSILSYKNTLGKKWLIGRYKIEFNASYGEKGQLLSRSIYVVIFPWRLCCVVILTIIIFIILLKKTVSDSHKQVHTLENKLEEEEKEIGKLKEMLEKKKE